MKYIYCWRWVPINAYHEVVAYRTGWETQQLYLFCVPLIVRGL